MKPFKGTTEIQVFDNCYSKPVQQGDTTAYSVGVCFVAHGTIFHGQFHYTTSEWHIHTGSLHYKDKRGKEHCFGHNDSPVKMPTIPDRDVEFWFHAPWFEEVLEGALKTEKSNGRPSKMRNRPYIDPNVGV